MSILREDVADRIREQLDAWEGEEVSKSLARMAESKAGFTSSSGLPLKRVYTAADIADIPLEDIGLPGQYPFTRGPYPTMYRARPWTIRQVAGFGNPEATNNRYKYMIDKGQTGLSTDFDLPTLLGYDSDHQLAFGEVGREGVAIDTIHDMHRLFAGLDLEQISVSMTINATAWIIYAMYVSVVRARGFDPHRAAGTLQADILKEYVAQKEWIFPVRPSMRLVRDLVMYSAGHTRRFNPISLSGYHMAEMGANAIQEVAFVLANTIAYCDLITAAGMNIDEFAPRLSFFFVSQQDFFEEICKFRAARRLYAKIMKVRYGAKNPESLRMRVHAQTAATTLTKTQPVNNLMRTAYQALSAVLGGCQSMHTNGFDEAFTIPTEEAMKLAIRTQQILRDETNVTAVTDPLGGSYFIETLTSQLEAAVENILKEVEKLGGAVKLTEEGWFQQRIVDRAYEIQKELSNGAKQWIGVNSHVEENASAEVETHPYDEECTRRQIERTNEVRRSRNGARVKMLLAELRLQAQDPAINLMSKTIELVNAEATLQEICDTLRETWGTYKELPVF